MLTLPVTVFLDAESESDSLIPVVQIFTPTKFEALFGDLSYNAVAFVLDSTLSSPTAVLVSDGAQTSCNQVQYRHPHDASAAAHPELYLHLYCRDSSHLPCRWCTWRAERCDALRALEQ